ncbi:MAG: hypothetical protein HWQ38_07860 [Nostoc sp. NMS7]|uniref:hypothetical protein n=1 Tax=Nostoc sp. NMS7 TaxID=2815391 RepID=UPI0025D3266B|nr:hypothetical protein [Nostoc sp. NMS7]MBN3946397.1 hypothetical protein [Nostoc sp. NMS7]
MKERIKTSPATQQKTRSPIAELPQTNNSESAIASKPTQQDVVFPQAGKLTTGEMKNKVSSIARTIKTKGLKVSETIIREKILELYPNSEDWISDDARLDVIRAVEKAMR